MIKNQNALYGDELLVAAFAHLKPNSTFKVVDTSDIVRAFYQVRNADDWSDLFVNYPFDTDGIEPRSVEMTEAIQALQQARLLGRKNPDLVDYSVAPGMRLSYDRFVKPKLGNKEHLVQKLADRLKAVLGVSETDDPPDATTTPPN